jgi:hypothetical protein
MILYITKKEKRLSQNLSFGEMFKSFGIIFP